MPFVAECYYFDKKKSSMSWKWAVFIERFIVIKLTDLERDWLVMVEFKGLHLSYLIQVAKQSEDLHGHSSNTAV